MMAEAARNAKSVSREEGYGREEEADAYEEQHYQQHPNNDNRYQEAHDEDVRHGHIGAY